MLRALRVGNRSVRTAVMNPQSQERGMTVKSWGWVVCGYKEMTANGGRVSLRDDENVLELDCSNRHTTQYIFFKKH